MSTAHLQLTYITNSTVTYVRQGQDSPTENIPRLHSFIRFLIKEKNMHLIHTLFHYLYYYYDVKLIRLFGVTGTSICYFNFHFIEPYTQKHLTLYRLEKGPIPVKDKKTEVNLYPWL